MRGSARIAKGVNLYRLDIRAMPDGLRCELTFGFTGKLPTAPKRKEAVLAMLRDVANQIEERGLVDIGQAEKTAKAGSKAENLRRDLWQIGDGGAT